MGPWSEPSGAKTRVPTSSARPAEWGLIGGLLALCIFGALALWISRYEIGTAGGVPARLDRFTGQVIGCVPGQGCLELIPAGTPALRNAVMQRVQSGAPTTPPNAPATGNATPAVAPPPSQPASPAPATHEKPHG